ncbi:MAG: hypothetical protein GF411_06450 [Candidatus Lokiarchaeota archaeon]|nr:hypothetical protein [Candidatus Lokiarchaeota archaeon]
MIEDDSSSSSDEHIPITPFRRVLGIAGAILVLILYFLYSLYFPYDYLTGVFLFPPVIFLFLILAGCCGTGCTASVNREDEESVLHAMRKRALYALKIEGRDIYRCPNCEMSFDLANATPVDDDVILCPFCKNRLLFE